MSTLCVTPVTEGIELLRLDLTLEPGPCEEPSAISDALNGRLTAHLTVIRLQDSLRGYFEGDWVLQNGQTTVAGGRMTGTVGAGTHHGLRKASNACENCREPEHYEGLLTGRVWIGVVNGEYEGARIYASLVGHGPLGPQFIAQDVAIEGVVVSRCLHPPQP